MLGKEGRTAVEDALKSFELLQEEGPPASEVAEVRRQPGSANVQVQVAGKLHSLDVASGSIAESSLHASPYISTSYHDSLLSDLMTSHLAHDMCIIGPRVSLCKFDRETNQPEVLNWHIPSRIPPSISLI